MGMILAFDVGTTSMKGILFSETLDELYSVTIEYTLDTSASGLAELDPMVYFNGFCRCIDNIKEKQFNLQDIQGICFTTQGETMIPVDKEGTPLSPAVVWLDVRAGQEAEFLKEKVSRQEFYSHTGLCDVDGALPAAKVLWFKNNQPELYCKTYKFLLLEDYLIYKLTDRFVSEKSLQSSTGWYDIVGDTYYDAVVNACNFDVEKFPEILPCGAVVGTVSKNIAESLGLSASALVVAGAMDQVASAIGAGNIKEGIVTETTGTALVLGATIEKPAFSPDAPITIYKHYNDQFIYIPFFSTAGIVLKWFRDTVVPYADMQAKERGISSYQILDEMAKNSPVGSHGVVMNPDFTNGGAVYGLTLSTKVEDMTRSVLEGVAFMLRDLLEAIEKQGKQVTEIYSLGGGAYSDIWCSIKASVCDKAITAVKYNQTTALGAAILCAVALGKYESVEAALTQLKAEGTKYLPDAHDKAVYDACYVIYKNYLENGGK